MTDLKKPKSRPFKKFYCDRDEVFLLPPAAFKLWWFYYKHESAKRESWLSRETIVKKCGLDKDAVTKWRNWLVSNGWMKKVGEHKTPGHFFGVPIMQITRGTIPTISDGRGKSKASRATQFKRREITATDATENFRHTPVTENPVLPVAGNSGFPVTGNSRAEVDKNLSRYKTEVDGSVESRSGSFSKPDQNSLPVGVAKIRRVS